MRERLASEADLFQHWRTLLNAIESNTPLDDVDRLASVDLETVAAFADGRLNFDEAADFERFCWKNPNVLREVVSVIRSVHTDVLSIDVPTRFAQQMSSWGSEVKPRRRSRSTMTAVALIGALFCLTVFFLLRDNSLFSR